MGIRKPGWELEVGNQGEPRTGLGREPGTVLSSKIGEPRGTGNRPEFQNWGTRGNREPAWVQKVGNHVESGTDFDLYYADP